MSCLTNKPAISGAAGTPGGSPVRPSSAEGTKRFTRIVGVVTAVVGGALVAAPARVGPVMALTDPTATRLIGLADLALVPGLVVGRPQWPWLAGRAVLNLVIAGHLLALARDAERPRFPRAVAAAFGAITVGDIRSTAALRWHATDDRHDARWTA